MNQLLLEFKKLDSSILKLMMCGIRFSFVLLILACLVLLTYVFVYTYPIIYRIGFSLFKSSLFFMVGFIVFGFTFNVINKDLKS